MGWLLGIKGYAIAIAIAAAILIAAITVYVIGSEKARGQRDVLEAEKAALLIEDKRKGAQIKSLNESIAAHNQALIDQIAADKVRVAEAQAAAEKLRKQRDKITAELANSRRAWAEAIANDATLREWVNGPVPAAVWDRLRIATGQ